MQSHYFSFDLVEDGYQGDGSGQGQRDWQGDDGQGCWTLCTCMDYMSSLDSMNLYGFYVVMDFVVVGLCCCWIILDYLLLLDYIGLYVVVVDI